jgi:uncharacterized protein
MNTMATQNRQLMEEIFAALEVGDGQPFLDSLAGDFVWRMIGTTDWSGTYVGKEAVRRQLLDPLFAKFAAPYVNKAKRFIAERDHVVVECQGSTTTKSGEPYANTYCWVCRLKDGKLVELTEYMDTQLIADRLGSRVA